MDQWQQDLAAAKTEDDRIALAKNPQSPVELLECFIQYDTEASVVLAAALNPQCPDTLLPLAAKRAKCRYSLLLRKKRQHGQMNWQTELKNATHVFDRLALAKRPDCHIDLLETFVRLEEELVVVLAAATHPRCPETVLGIAAERTGISVIDLLRMRKENSTESSAEAQQGKEAFSDRDGFLTSHVIQRDNQHAKIHLGDYDIEELRAIKKRPKADDGPYKKHIVFVMCPSWGIIFPPYNLARLTGLLRHHGYKVTVFDLNIESYYVLKEKTGLNFWSSEKYHLWFEDKFASEIWPHIADMIEDCVENIFDLNPDVIGFSLYNTNMWCSRMMLNLIRDLMPEVPILVGGPEAAQDIVLNIVRPGIINYVFKGEAEHTLLTFLENGEYLADAVSEVVGNLDSKLALDDFPFPDYSDYEISQYLHPDGVSIETSRGCIAQCSFCSETWFWKFRQRTSERVIEEMQDQIEKYGVRRFWFVDSLVNGNIKEFRKLVDLIIANKLDIRWNSYARNDGRMDRDFIFKIAASGCTSLSFGVESGSQKVLNDMRKKIELWEIEQNLKDCYDAGMDTHVNWMIGFPTEENLDFLHGMVLIANTAKYFAAISPGMGCGPAAFSDLERSWKLYNITWKSKPFDTLFLGHWFTENYENTALHRMVRIKIFAVFLEILRDKLSIAPHNGQRYDDVGSFYHLSLDGTPRPASVPKLDNLDLNLFRDGSLSARIANEYIGLGWILHRIFNCGFTLRLIYDPVVDYRNLGAYIAVNYRAEIAISVNSDGDFQLVVDHDFKHDTLNLVWKEHIARERYVEDMSFKDRFHHAGNFADLITEVSMVKETVHVNYRNKSKRQVSVPVEALQVQTLVTEP